VLTASAGCGVIEDKSTTRVLRRGKRAMTALVRRP
jgi:hypothetical protein